MSIIREASRNAFESFFDLRPRADLGQVSKVPSIASPRNECYDAFELFSKEL